MTVEVEELLVSNMLLRTFKFYLMFPDVLHLQCMGS